MYIWNEFFFGQHLSIYGILFYCVKGLLSYAHILCSSLWLLPDKWRALQINEKKFSTKVYHLSEFKRMPKLFRHLFSPLLAIYTLLFTLPPHQWFAFENRSGIFIVSFTQYQLKSSLSALFAYELVIELYGRDFSPYLY